MSPTFEYHQPTDALYIKLRAGESVDNEIFADGEFVIDIRADGALFGYEIQHASTKRDFIAADILGEVVQLQRRSKPRLPPRAGIP